MGQNKKKKRAQQRKKLAAEAKAEETLIEGVREGCEWTSALSVDIKNMDQSSDINCKEEDELMKLVHTFTLPKVCKRILHFKKLYIV